MRILLQKEGELQEVVQLVGPDALQDNERLLLEMGKLLREIFLQQNAFSEADAFSSLEKTAGLLEALLAFYDMSREVLGKGITLNQVLKLPVREDLAHLRNVPSEDFTDAKASVLETMRNAFTTVTSTQG